MPDPIPDASAGRARTAEIEDALDVLLRAIVEHDLRPRAGSGGPTLYSFAELSDLAEAERRSVTANPVRWSLRQGVATLGRHLFRVLGSTGAMGEVLERVAALDPSRYGRRASIMDHAWHGIGDGRDVWIA